MTWIYEVISAAIIAFSSAFASWFFTRRQYNAESRSTEIDNVKKTMQYYQELCDDLNRRLEGQSETLDKLYASNLELKESNAKLAESNLKLIQLNHELTLKIDELEKNIANLYAKLGEE